jgi:adenylate kinase
VRIVFVLGGPGAGKGTQCAKLVEAYGFTHLSAGDLLREEVASGSAVGEECAAIMREGKLVPMEVTIGLLRKAMVKAGARDFLIDGFPRALDQAERFEALVKPCEAVLFFDCPEEVMEARLLKRGETSGRADDNAETIRKRFRTFVEQSVPVVERYEALGKAHRVEATRAPHEVFADVQVIVDRLRAASPVVPAPAAAVNGGKQQQQQAEAAAPVAVTAAAPALAFA